MGTSVCFCECSLSCDGEPGEKDVGMQARFCKQVAGEQMPTGQVAVAVTKGSTGVTGTRAEPWSSPEALVGKWLSHRVPVRSFLLTGCGHDKRSVASVTSYYKWGGINPTTQIYPPSGLKWARAAVWAGPVPSEAPGENPFPGRFQLPAAACVPQPAVPRPWPWLSSRTP